MRAPWKKHIYWTYIAQKHFLRVSESLEWQLFILKTIRSFK